MKERDVRFLIKKGELQNEFDHERALQADRRLRILVKEDPSFKELRKELQELIVRYEKKYWSDESKVTEQQLHKSDLAEKIAEKERRFIHDRREIILSRLNKLDLKQKDLGVLLDHNKSYISELLNGIRSFSLTDLVVIHRLLKIELKDLFPTTIPFETQKKLRESIAKMSPNKVKLKEKDLELVAV